MDSSSQDDGSRRGTPLALIERLDRDGRVLQSMPVYRWPISIGRAFESDLVLDDPHVAPQHAELREADGVLQLSLGQTINGAMVGEQHLQAGQSLALAPAQAWRIGDTRLRVRRPGDPLAPERPMAHHLARKATTPAATAWGSLAFWAAASLAWMLVEQWLGNDPGTPLTTYLSATLAMLVGVGVWAFFWALGSKLFQGHLDFTAHLRLALRYGLLWSVVVAVLPLMAFSTGWAGLSRVADAAGAVVLCALVWAHLCLILPGHRQALFAGMAALYLGGFGLNTWFNVQRSGRVFSELYVTALPPPAWRLAKAQPPAVLIDDARALKAKLDKQAQDDNAEDMAEAAED